MKTFGDLLDAHQGEILKYVLRLTRDRQDADDLFQETFLKAFAAFGQLDANANHRAWLYRIATNTYFNHVRRSRRRGEVALEDGIPDGRPPQDATLAVQRNAAAIRRAIGTLPPRQRAAYMQRHFHELPYEQIAEILGCSADAVRANVYQAIRRIRSAVAGGTGTRRAGERAPTRKRRGMR